MLNAGREDSDQTETVLAVLSLPSAHIPLSGFVGLWHNLL